MAAHAVSTISQSSSINSVLMLDQQTELDDQVFVDNPSTVVDNIGVNPKKSCFRGFVVTVVDHLRTFFHWLLPCLVPIRAQEEIKSINGRALCKRAAVETQMEEQIRQLSGWLQDSQMTRYRLSDDLCEREKELNVLNVEIDQLRESENELRQQIVRSRPRATDLELVIRTCMVRTEAKDRTIALREQEKNQTESTLQDTLTINEELHRSIHVLNTQINQMVQSREANLRSAVDDGAVGGVNLGTPNACNVCYDEDSSMIELNCCEPAEHICYGCMEQHLTDRLNQLQRHPAEDRGDGLICPVYHSPDQEHVISVPNLYSMLQNKPNIQYIVQEYSTRVMSEQIFRGAAANEDDHLRSMVPMNSSCPRCTRANFANIGFRNRTVTVVCESCSHSYCASCNSQTHDNISCEQAVEQARGASVQLQDALNNYRGYLESEMQNPGQRTDTNVINNSVFRPCPDCEVPVMRVDSCLHVQRTGGYLAENARYYQGGCNHDFCWDCLQKWPEISFSDHSFYRCNNTVNRRIVYERRIDELTAELAVLNPSATVARLSTIAE